MILVVIILSLFLLVLGMVFFIPVYLEVNTDENIYRIYQPGTVGFYVQKMKDRWRLRGRIFFIKFDINKRNKKAKASDIATKTKKKVVKKRKITDKRALIEKGKQLFSSLAGAFKIKRLSANLDTGDFSLNAWLIPVFVTTGVQNSVKVNFENKNSLDLKISARIYKIVYYSLKFYIQSKKLIIKN